MAVLVYQYRELGVSFTKWTSNLNFKKKNDKEKVKFCDMW